MYLTSSSPVNQYMYAPDVTILKIQTIFLSQILGFDILLDEKLRPFLLEVNAHPSLRVDFEQPVRPGVVEYVPSPVDLAIKLPVVRDTLTIIGRKIRWGGSRL